MSYRTERQEFIDAMATEGMVHSDAELILRHTQTIQRLGIAELGRVLTEQDKQAVRRAENRIRLVIHEYQLSGSPLWRVAWNSDARGPMVAILGPSGRTDNVARTGISVPFDGRRTAEDRR